MKFRKKDVQLSIIKKDMLNRELILITSFSGVPKSFKMDIIIQKCTELGANSITPVFIK